jgi:hypothetical protein
VGEWVGIASGKTEDFDLLAIRLELSQEEGFIQLLSALIYVEKRIILGPLLQ